MVIERARQPLLGLLLLAWTTKSLTASLPRCSPETETLVWEEQFDTLDTSVWQHFVTAWRGGNDEFQYYRNDRRNSYVRDGILYIKPTLTADEFGEDFLYNGALDLWDDGCEYDMDIDGGCSITASTFGIINPIQSARLRSSIGFSFKYGRVEVRAQMPKGDWLWPAIWMMPTDKSYGYWPKSGEIDLVEAKGNEELVCWGHPFGPKRMGSAMHWGPDYSNFDSEEMGKKDFSNSFADSFHTFGLKWTEDSLTFTVDGFHIGTVAPPEGGFWEKSGFSGTNLWADGTKMAPFDKRFHFILNVAVGGNYFLDTENCVNGEGNSRPKPWLASNKDSAMEDFWNGKSGWYPTWLGEDAAMKVDYIKVYQ